MLTEEGLQARKQEAKAKLNSKEEDWKERRDRNLERSGRDDRRNGDQKRLTDKDDYRDLMNGFSRNSSSGSGRDGYDSPRNGSSSRRDRSRSRRDDSDRDDKYRERDRERDKRRDKYRDDDRYDSSASRKSSPRESDRERSHRHDDCRR